jgi:hypothetical protein
VSDAIGDRQRRRCRRQRFVIIGVWSIGRTEHRDVGDRIDEATNSPRAGRFSTGGEERPVGTHLGAERRRGRREERQAVRGRDDEAPARPLDDEAVSVTNFEAALNKRSSLRVEPNRAHQRSDRRWAAPRPAAKIAQPRR